MNMHFGRTPCYCRMLSSQRDSMNLYIRFRQPDSTMRISHERILLLTYYPISSQNDTKATRLLFRPPRYGAELMSSDDPKLSTTAANSGKVPPKTV